MPYKQEGRSENPKSQSAPGPRGSGSSCCSPCCYNVPGVAREALGAAPNQPASSASTCYHLIDGQVTRPRVSHPTRPEPGPKPQAPQLGCSPWPWGCAHLLLLAISFRCLSIVSIKSRNWGQSQSEARSGPRAGRRADARRSSRIEKRSLHSRGGWGSRTGRPTCPSTRQEELRPKGCPWGLSVGHPEKL